MLITGGDKLRKGEKLLRKFWDNLNVVVYRSTLLLLLKRQVSRRMNTTLDCVILFRVTSMNGNAG